MKVAPLSAPNSQSHRLEFRADVQSLRALAIVLVVAAHAGVPYLRGGYIGVDVFFVLSGYLISGLLWNEIQNSGRFDAISFYGRRLKRLAPALIVVLLGTGAAASYLIGPQRQIVDAAAGQAAAIWMSNFYFAARVVDYFSAGAGGNLFLHTWSLGVEEQFYLIWPWLMMFLLGANRWQGRQFKRKHLLGGWIILGLLSIALSVYWSQTQLHQAFYLVPGRIWEFALGALVFAVRDKLGGPRWIQRLQGRSILNGFGWLMIVSAAFTLDDSLRYPGLFALWPCTGAALALLDRPSSASREWFSHLIVESRGLQLLGNLSYSLYLWHWPALLLGQAILGPAAWVRAGMVLLALALAGLTYVLVERPIHRIKLRRHRWLPLTSGITAAGMVFLVMSDWQIAAHRLMSSPAQQRINAAMVDLPALYDVPGCDTWYHSDAVKVCIFGPAQASHTVVIFGDSVMAQWFPAITAIYLARPDWHVAVLTKSACSASDVSYTYDKVHGVYTVCDRWRHQAIAEIERLRPDVVFLGSTHYGFSTTQWITGTRAVLSKLSPIAGTVLVMSPTPELGFNGLACLSSKSNMPAWLSRWKSCSSPLPPIRKGDVHCALEQAVQPFANAHLIDMRDVICPGGRCHAEFRGDIVYRDGQHLTAKFIESLAQDLLAAVPATARPN